MVVLNIFRNPSKCSSVRSQAQSDEHEDSTVPLLTSSTIRHDRRITEEGDPDTDFLSKPHRRKKGVSRCWWIPLAAASGILGVVATVAAFSTIRRTQSPGVQTTSTPTDLVASSATYSEPATAARLAVDSLYARQSKTLEEAISRYTLRTGRSTPPNYGKWFQFAQEKKCLIDDYDQIHRDFKPFYQLAKDDPAHFQKMIERASHKLREKSAEIAIIEIKKGEVHIAENSGTAYAGNWPGTLGRFSQGLPDMTFLLNGRDEPRVAFNFRSTDAKKNAFTYRDLTPFEIAPRPTTEFFEQQNGCIVPKDATGLMLSANEDSGFLISSAKPGFTTDLYPIISMAKISPCFSDILFPTEYYYDQSWWSGKFAYPDNIPWEDKKPQIYWRGMSNGGMIMGQNYHHFARFKLADLARNHSDLMDISITRFAETLCEEGCDREAVIAEYNITGSSELREEMYRYKYAIDVDGTTFSGRYLGLLRSGSLVFKSTLFEEYFNDWLTPYEHYIPVLPDLSDLIDKIEWANANPEEAWRIQKRGWEVARRVITDDQNDCYFFAVLLEWARLQDYAQTFSA